MPKEPAATVKPFGLYIHIPFCRARCGYCDFVTFTERERQIPEYVDRLIWEIQRHAGQKTVDGRLESVFFGGGTPSLLEAEQVRRILAAVSDAWDMTRAEVTLEANPESVSRERVDGWKGAGINRMSLGLQSMDDTLLKSMGRLHTAEEFKTAYEAVRRGGIENVNVDLIYGFQGHAMATWQDTVRQVIALNPEHISLYALTVEAHTPFAAQGHRTDNDLQADLYAWARPVLADAGYVQYEISNVAKPGFECRHNLLYWRQNDYLGVGVGAVGCVANRRWQVVKNLAAYEEQIARGDWPWELVETLAPETQKFERLMLGLRLRQGFEWGDESNPRWREERDRLAKQGWLEETRPGVWRIPDQAVAFTNQILLPFL